ncbi:aminotransferase-like domain-containing protein [Agaribacter flavus]|uniref:PLP-dependent aminotransferase family protein n=1 Tax=Agaribacter flavus TaxID=1902781 RepID=A0ABV7FSX0_9ALTE
MANNKIWVPNLEEVLLASTPPKPLYQQIVDAMAHDIASGKLAIGEKLPPQRRLAWHLGINLSTVTKAFRQAAKQQLISGEVGRGTYVLGQSAEAELFLLNQSAEKNVIDLSTHQPAQLLDIDGKDNALELAIAKLSEQTSGLSEYLNYQSPSFVAELKIAGAKWLSGLGYKISSQHCLITNTAQNALMISLMACCQKDEVVLVNELTFPGMKALAKQMGIKLYGVKSDHLGLVPEALALAIRSTGAKVMVSDPLYQNPTAASMNDRRMNDIKAIIRDEKLLFIEEYVIGTLSGRAPISADIQSQSIVISSFAKAISPGIRFAVIAGKHAVFNQISQQSHATSWQLSPLTAAIAKLWIDDGTAYHRTKAQQREIAMRFRLFAKAFPKHVKTHKVNVEPLHTNKFKDNVQNAEGENIAHGIPICSHVWLQVSRDADFVADQLKKQGVRVVPASVFAVSHKFPNAIRVSLTAAKSHEELVRALNIIKQSGFIKSG